MDEFELELKQDFLTEASQLIDDTEKAFLNLESDKDNPELMDGIFRLAHNLKGTSRAVGFGQVAEFTHEMENLILKIKNKEIAINDHVVTVLLECNDHVRYMLDTLKENMEANLDSVEMTAKVVAILNGESTQSEASAEIPNEVAPEDFSEPVVDEVTEIFGDLSAPVDLPKATDEQLEAMLDMSTLETLNNTEIDPDILKLEEELKNLVPLAQKEILETKTQQPPEGVLEFKKDAAPKNSTSAKNSSGNPPAVEESIRVSLSRVEMLNNYVGELVIIQSMLSQSVDVNISQSFAKSLTHLGKLSKEIQDIAMRLRMLPIKGIFTKMQRIVRDTSKALGKEVILHIDGDETEVDKTVLEQLSDPLVHIIRNAVDHGIEDNSDDRTQIGKKPQGNVYLNAFHEGNKLVIEIGDDGKGINPDVIRRKAIEKGIIKADQNLSDREAIQLIFHPGFSTKDQVSEISGRGVGMDVVKTNITKISGDVFVESHVGKGSLFRISLPLTLAIIEGMVTTIGAEKYVVPLGQIHETVQLTPENTKFVSGVGECLNLRGEIIPALQLGKVLKRGQHEKEIHSQIGIVVRGKRGAYAIAVDDILNQQQVVIKKIGEEIRNKKGFMGSSILGDGKPAFILDLNEIIDSAAIGAQTSSRVAA